MKLTQWEKEAISLFVSPLINQCALPRNIDDYIANDCLTAGQLDEIQRHIDTVLFTAGKSPRVFNVKEAQNFKHMQQMAADAHFSLRHLRSYKWDVPRRG